MARARELELGNVTFLPGVAARGGAGALPRRRRLPGAAARGAALPLLHPVEDVRDPGLRPPRPRVARGRGRGDPGGFGRRARGAAGGRRCARGRRHAARGRSRAARDARRPRAAVRRGALRPQASRGPLSRGPRGRGSGHVERQPYNHSPFEEPALVRQRRREGPARRGGPAELHEGGADHARHGRARGPLRAAPRPHRAALRRGDVAGVLRRARHRASRREPGGGLGQPRGPDRRDHAALRARDRSLPAGLAGGRGRRQLDDGRDARRRPRSA